jgi:drug/metabolite transporter (DMT)-like permease
MERVLKHPSLAILCLCAGISVFSVQDLILKLLSDRYPLSEAMVLRSLAAVPCFLVILRVFDGGFQGVLSPTWPKMLVRGLLNFLSYTAYYLALARLPIATTVALFFTGPFFITLLAVAFLDERVSLGRWLALGCGFVGVVIMVRPGAVFDWAALLPVFCGLAYAGSMVLARAMGQRDSAAAMAFWGNFAFLFCSALLAALFGRGAIPPEGLHPSLAFLLRPWVWPSLTDAALMSACGLIAAIGLTLLTQAYRIGQSAAVAPFEFSFAFWGLLWGWLFFDQLPDGLGWLGIAIIIASGVYIVRAEAK